MDDKINHFGANIITYETPNIVTRSHVEGHCIIIAISSVSPYRMLLLGTTNLARPILNPRQCMNFFFNVMSPSVCKMK